MPDADFYLSQGDTGSPIKDTLTDADGNAIDLAGAGVRFEMRPIAGGAGFLADADNLQSGDGSDGSKGKVQYRWNSSTGDVATAGRFLAHWEVTYPSTIVQTFPNDGYLLVVITPDMPTSVGQNYITAEQLKNALELKGTTFADQEINGAITAACRAIDNLCDRRFYQDGDAAQIRYYSPLRPDRLEVDDLVTLTSLVSADDGTTGFANTWTLNTDFFLEPLNASADGWPYTLLRAHPTGAFLFNTVFPRSVRVTGQFGWPAVPSGIEDAATILAAQLVRRKREAPFGIVSVGMDGLAVRLARSDPQVSMLIRPYQRHAYAAA